MPNKVWVSWVSIDGQSAKLAETAHTRPCDYQGQRKFFFDLRNEPSNDPQLEPNLDPDLHPVLVTCSTSLIKPLNELSP